MGKYSKTRKVLSGAQTTALAVLLGKLFIDIQRQEGDTFWKKLTKEQKQFFSGFYNFLKKAVKGKSWYDKMAELIEGFDASKEEQEFQHQKLMELLIPFGYELKDENNAGRLEEIFSYLDGIRVLLQKAYVSSNQGLDRVFFNLISHLEKCAKNESVVSNMPANAIQEEKDKANAEQEGNRTIASIANELFSDLKFRDENCFLLKEIIRILNWFKFEDGGNVESGDFIDKFIEKRRENFKNKPGEFFRNKRENAVLAAENVFTYFKDGISDDAKATAKNDILEYLKNYYFYSNLEGGGLNVHYLEYGLLQDIIDNDLNCRDRAQTSFAKILAKGSAEAALGEEEEIFTVDIIAEARENTVVDSATKELASGSAAFCGIGFTSGGNHIHIRNRKGNDTSLVQQFAANQKPATPEAPKPDESSILTKRNAIGGVVGFSVSAILLDCLTGYGLTSRGSIIPYGMLIPDPVKNNSLVQGVRRISGFDLTSSNNIALQETCRYLGFGDSCEDEKNEELLNFLNEKSGKAVIENYLDGYARNKENYDELLSKTVKLNSSNFKRYLENREKMIFYDFFNRTAYTRSVLNYYYNISAEYDNRVESVLHGKDEKLKEEWGKFLGFDNELPNFLFSTFQANTSFESKMHTVGYIEKKFREFYHDLELNRSFVVRESESIIKNETDLACFQTTVSLYLKMKVSEGKKPFREELEHIKKYFSFAFTNEKSRHIMNIIFKQYMFETHKEVLLEHSGFSWRNIFDIEIYDWKSENPENCIGLFYGSSANKYNHPASVSRMEMCYKKVAGVNNFNIEFSVG